jgi:beta-galactosidase GanA
VNLRFTRGLFCLSALVWLTNIFAATPTLVAKDHTIQLRVDGKPFLMIAGELSNSAASNAEYMAPHWARLKAMHLNTVLAPVSWELIEPQEGKFDWSQVDSLIKNARANDLKLVMLWFGAWKNSMSTYVPSWVKRDQARFPRAVLPDGQSVEILSTFGRESLLADQKALAALMTHIKSVDDKNHTVLMVQVENEIGMLPVARDCSDVANKAFAQPVPQELSDYIVKHQGSLVPEMNALWREHGAKAQGSWTEMFGEGDAAAEIFTAWHYAKFADALAAIGKAQYALPMYVNVALNRPGRKPGEYPSGGPLPHLIDIWKAGGPNLDLLAPDIYFANFTEIVARYHRPDNVLFIPEAHNADNPVVPANAFYAMAQHNAIGFGPFSIDSIDSKPNKLQDAYAVLEQLSPFILDAQGTQRIAGFKPYQHYDDSIQEDAQTKEIGEYRFTVSFTDNQHPATAETVGYGGMIIQIGPEEYLIAGQGITVTFQPKAGGLAGIDSAYEGVFRNGRWLPGRLLNGDQTHQGRHIRLTPGEWQIQRVKFYSYR